MFDSFKVKSTIRDYEVHFINDLVNSLRDLVIEGDFIFIDDKFSKIPGICEFINNNQNVIRIAASESTKSYEGVINFFDQLINKGFKRNNKLIAVGGGITQDITSFIASVLYRGVDWIFFPTTLLAQADSCIGSKTSINFRDFKNQIGNFYPPLSIYICTQALSTLQERDIRSGVGEMAHYFFVSGPRDVDFFEREYTKTIFDQSNIQMIINASLSIKKRFIEIDEFDRKERIVFNYGHTFGHAIESITNYSIPHGVAVSFGMDLANFVSFKKGYIKIEDYKRAHIIFSNIWNGYSIKNISIDLLINALEKDKKNENGMLGLILTKGWGNMFRDLTKPDLNFINWMKEYFSFY